MAKQSTTDEAMDDRERLQRPAKIMPQAAAIRTVPMNVTVTLPTDLETRLRSEAEAHGITIEEYIRVLLEQGAAIA